MHFYTEYTEYTDLTRGSGKVPRTVLNIDFNQKRGFRVTDQNETLIYKKKV